MEVLRFAARRSLGFAVAAVIAAVRALQRMSRRPGMLSVARSF